MSNQQLELFPDLPLGVRPPRRLRLLGFVLEQIERDADELAEIKWNIDRNERKAAIKVAKAKTLGFVIPEAYECVIKIEEARILLAARMRDTDELYRTLERQLAKGIERHLAAKGVRTMHPLVCARTQSDQGND